MFKGSNFQRSLRDLQKKHDNSNKNLNIKEEILSQDSSNGGYKAKDFEESHSSSSIDNIYSQEDSDDDSNIVKVRKSQIKKPPFTKYTTSRIYRDFTQISKEERQQSMKEVVENLDEQTKQYFDGRKARFENNADYFQCLSNPAQPDTFIMARSVKKGAA